MYKRIKLSCGLYTLINEEYSHLNEYTWKNNDGYASRTNYDENGHIIGQTRLHRLILNVTDSNVHVDHINGNRLDNRIENLRICSHNENHRNLRKKIKNKTSNFKGVHFSKQNKFIAQISVNKKKIYLGSFNSENEARDAYDKASELYHGEFGFNNSSKLDIIQDWSIYEELPRAIVKKKVLDIEVWCSNGKIYKSISEAAKDLNVKENTIIKACTDTKRIRRVRKQLVKYTGNNHLNIKEYNFTRK